MNPLLGSQWSVVRIPHDHWSLSFSLFFLTLIFAFCMLPSGAFGYFEVTSDEITKYCKAKLFSQVGKRTPLAVRFSTVGEYSECHEIYVGAETVFAD